MSTYWPLACLKKKKKNQKKNHRLLCFPFRQNPLSCGAAIGKINELWKVIKFYCNFNTTPRKNSWYTEVSINIQYILVFYGMPTESNAACSVCQCVGANISSPGLSVNMQWFGKHGRGRAAERTHQISSPGLHRRFHIDILFSWYAELWQANSPRQQRKTPPRGLETRFPVRMRTHPRLVR